MTTGGKRVLLGSQGLTSGESLHGSALASGGPRQGRKDLLSQEKAEAEEKSKTRGFRSHPRKTKGSLGEGCLERR